MELRVENEAELYLHRSAAQQIKGWRMVPRKSWVSQVFDPISKSRQPLRRVSKSRL